MRSIWKGHIRFLLVAIPIRVYNAIEASERIQFNQLHRDDFGPIGYDKRVGSSRVDLQACKLEYSIVSPK